MLGCQTAKEQPSKKTSAVRIDLVPAMCSMRFCVNIIEVLGPDWFGYPICDRCFEEINRELDRM